MKRKHVGFADMPAHKKPKFGDVSKKKHSFFIRCSVVAKGILISGGTREDKMVSEFLPILSYFANKYVGEWKLPEVNPKLKVWIGKKYDESSALITNPSISNLNTTNTTTTTTNTSTTTENNDQNNMNESKKEITETQQKNTIENEIEKEKIAGQIESDDEEDDGKILRPEFDIASHLPYKRIYMVNTAVPMYWFMGIYDDLLTPSTFIPRMFSDPEFEQQTKVLKFTEKILPIDYICWAQKSDILDLFKSKILPHFQSDSTTTTNTNTTETNNENKDILIMKHPQKPITSWKLEMKITNNKKLNKQELKKEFGSLTPREKYTVDLKDPDFIVFIDVFKDACGMVVLRGSDYVRFRKFNIQQYLKQLAEEKKKNQTNTTMNTNTNQ